MRIRFALLGLALAGAVSASAAPRVTTVPPPYEIETHVIGSGGYSVSADEDYAIDATIGEWSVGMVKLTAPVGYALDGGLWPYLSKADCTSPSPSFTTDLSVCR